MRFTPTHSGPDSSGVVRIGNWELEGRSYLFVVAGAVLAVLVFILAVGLSWPTRLLVSAVPLVASVGFIKFFLVNRPPHFAGDWCEGILVGRHFLQKPAELRPSNTTVLPFSDRDRPGGFPKRASKHPAAP